MGSILKHSMQFTIIVLDTITEKALVSVIILKFFCPIRTHILILIQGSMIQNIHSEEQKNTRLAENYENQQRLEQIYNRISFLRQSCRCRFVCTGLRLAESR